MSNEKRRIADAIYQAILDKRVLLVPVEPTGGMIDAWNDKSFGDVAGDVAAYKAMTQAVDTEKLIEEITR